MNHRLLGCSLRLLLVASIPAFACGSGGGPDSGGGSGVETGGGSGGRGGSGGAAGGKGDSGGAGGEAAGGKGGKDTGGAGGEGGDGAGGEAGEGGSPDGGTATDASGPRPTPANAVPSAACSGGGLPVAELAMAISGTGDVPALMIPYRTLTVGGQMRQLRVLGAVGYDGKTPTPAIMTFHGASEDSGHFLKNVFQFQGAPREKAALFLMEAVKNPGDPARVTQGWQADETPYFDAVVKWLDTNVCYDKSRLFAVGHSDGGKVVETLGCKRGDELRAIAHNGTRTGTIDACKGPIAAFAMWGVSENPGIKTESQQAAAAWAKLAGCDSSAPTAASDVPGAMAYQCPAEYPVYTWENPGDHKWYDVDLLGTKNTLAFFVKFF